MSVRAAWLLCLLSGLAVVGGVLAIGAVEGVQACDGAAALDPVIRFEWVRSLAEVEALFGQEPCRSRLAAAIDRVNRIDVWLFIPAFTLFQLFAALALSGRGRRLALVVAAAAILAAIADQAEDRLLFAITADLPGTQETIDRLFWFVRLKFALLACAAAALGLLLARGTGLARWLGLAMVAGGAVAAAGLADPRLLGPGIGLAWAALLVAAIAGSARPERSG